MSDLDEARAIRYFLDAFCDRDTISLALNQELYPVAIFHSQQVCEKCAKGCLALFAIMIARDHHASDLFNSSVIPVSGVLKSKFQRSLVFMSRLESYYIPSRYGVDTAGRVHYLKYDPDSVRELSQAAGDFLEQGLEFFEIRTGTSLPRSRELLEEYFLANYSRCIRRLE
jgi:HEPN domain-containing protein